MPPMNQNLGAPKMPTEQVNLFEESVNEIPDQVNYADMSDAELLNLKNDPNILERNKMLIKDILTTRMASNTVEDRDVIMYNRGN